MLVTMEDYPSIARVAEPFLRLAGVRIEPRNHSKHDTAGGYGIPTCARAMALVNVADGQEKSLNLSKVACADRPVWSADGKYFAFTNRTATAVELWLGDAASARLQRVNGAQLNPMFGDEFRWMPDQKSLLVKLVPKSIGAPPKAPVTPTGPSIQEARGEKGQSSTYEKRDTLSSKFDEELFDYYGKSQLALVDAQRATLAPLKAAPALYDTVRSAPDGKHVLITQIVRPYSYLITYDRFPRKVEVWDLSRPNEVARTPIADLPLADRVPVHGVPTGPRRFSWRATEPATLLWAEALDGGDWNVKVPQRDKVMMARAPFQAPQEIYRCEQRYEGIWWLEHSPRQLIAEYDDNKHWERTYVVDIDNAKEPKRLLWDLSSDEKYLDPGDPVFNYLKNGSAVVREDKNSIFLTGRGASPEGDRPFLDRLDMSTFKTERLFRSEKTAYELFLSFVNNVDEKSYMTWHQSPKDPPNVHIRTGSTVISLTHLPDPTPRVREIQKRLVKYKRADGVDLSFTLYTPPGYKEGHAVPTILYAYPLDYAEASKAGQITGSDATFTRLRSYRLLLMAGYAIIDQAAFPVVGDPKKAYDTYLEQLVADAKAAVDEAVKLGVADPTRIGVTGHSHGALMVANLLAHTDLFRAGVATSGSYNKTMTPFGFQSERRSVWEAPDVYRKVSPFFAADKIKAPLLIVHGEDDANPGTTPPQAHFLFEAIRGNGGTTRLVILPHEPHLYSALESNEQLVYEMVEWFDKYVKNVSAPLAVK
jgi:dipeptidyl aminopeptidase/acylaminoacyl peptidase